MEYVMGAKQVSSSSADGDRPVVVHVGLPKTATTSLQEGLLSRYEGWDYVGPHPRESKLRGWCELAEQMVASMSFAGEAEYRKHEPEYIEYFQEHHRPGRTLLISDEKLTTGHHFISRSPYNDCWTIADRIHRMFPSARIILSLRSQYSYLPSYFGEMLRHGCVPSSRFSDWFALQVARRTEGIPNAFEVGDYLRLYWRYCELFGKEQVRVLFFEDFISDGLRYTQHFVEHVGFEWEAVSDAYLPLFSNSRITHRERVMRDIYNKSKIAHLVPRGIRRAVFRIGSKGKPMAIHKFDGEERALLDDIYGADNRELARQLGVNLAELGYPLPDHSE